MILEQIRALGVCVECLFIPSKGELLIWKGVCFTDFMVTGCVWSYLEMCNKGLVPEV